jgi:hypothetical protein
VWDELEAPVGDHVNIDLTHEVRQNVDLTHAVRQLRAISPFDGVRWIFVARTPDDEMQQ